MHDIDDLIEIFDHCFFESYNTRLTPGGEEPVYLPASADCTWHRICFAHGFFSSALHECAHWLIAGSRRRLLEDYGYWYAPDGRNAKQQHIFYQVEVKPQALECILARAAQFPFHISSDNLKGDCAGEQRFALDVQQQVEQYYQQGLPERAVVFHEKLSHFYQQKRCGNAIKS